MLWMPALVAVALALSGCGHSDSGARVAARSAPAVRSPLTPARTVTLEIGGMTCSACVEKIEGQLTRVQGVRSARVSLAERRARVECDASLPDSALIAAVRRAGPEYLGLIVR